MSNLTTKNDNKYGINNSTDEYADRAEFILFTLTGHYSIPMEFIHYQGLCFDHKTLNSN